MDSPFIGGDYKLGSVPASVQRTVNMIWRPLEPGNERAGGVLKDIPGLTKISTSLPTPTGILNHFETTDSGNVVSEIGPNLDHGEYLATTPAPVFGAKQGGLSTNAFTRHTHISSVTLDATKSWKAEGWFYPTSATPQDGFFAISMGIYGVELSRYGLLGDAAFLAGFTTILGTGSGRYGMYALMPPTNVWTHMGVQYNGTTGVFSTFVGQVGTGTLITAQPDGTSFVPTPNLFGTSKTAGVVVGSQSAYPDEFYFRNVKDSELYTDGYTIPTKPFSAGKQGGSIRGLWNHNDTLYSVEDDGLFTIDSAGNKTYLQAMTSFAGNVDFASNLTQLCVNDGSYLSVYTPASGSFKVAANYPGGDRISFLDQRINFLFRGGQQFGWTAPGDATSIDELDFSSAEGSPDILVSQVATSREIYLFGRESTEIWDPSTGSQPYERNSAAINFGCVAPFSAQATANAVIWLGQDKNGQAMVLSTSGHQPQRISTQAQEERFKGLDLSGATAFVFSDAPFSFYCLNVPGLDTTLVWEETFGRWVEFAEGYTGAWTKWRPTCHAFAYGKHYFGAADGLYVLDPTVHKFGSDPIVRERIAPVISSPTHSRVTYDLFEVICEQGTGAQMAMQFSDDNGRTWSNWAYTTVGDKGQYARRARFRRLGAAYDRVFRVRFSDDAPFNPIMANVGFK